VKGSVPERRLLHRSMLALAYLIVRPGGRDVESTLQFPTRNGATWPPSTHTYQNVRPHLCITMYPLPIGSSVGGQSPTTLSIIFSPLFLARFGTQWSPLPPSGTIRQRRLPSPPYHTSPAAYPNPLSANHPIYCFSLPSVWIVAVAPAVPS
jgi:hypothetical protein